MMYPFMTLDDDTEVVHSEMLPDQRVKVYFEKPDAKDCFHSAVCYLPDYKWEDINGFTPEEIARYQELLESTAHLILQFSKEGGVENAAGRAGKYYLGNNNSQIPPRVLRNIMAIIEARSAEVIAKWTAFFGEADYFC